MRGYGSTMQRIATLMICLLALSGCAGGHAEYPSLAVRDVERAEGQFQTGEPKRIEVPQVEVDLNGDLNTTLAGLVRNADSAHAEFTRIEPRANRLVSAASGSGVGSDSWASAQVALAELNSARSLAAVPLADLDILLGAANVAAEDATAIEAARGHVEMLIRQEDAALAGLRARIR